MNSIDAHQKKADEAVAGIEQKLREALAKRNGKIIENLTKEIDEIEGADCFPIFESQLNNLQATKKRTEYALQKTSQALGKAEGLLREIRGEIKAAVEENRNLENQLRHPPLHFGATLIEQAGSGASQYLARGLNPQPPSGPSIEELRRKYNLPEPQPQRC